MVTDSLADAYRRLTEGCGLVDRSERGKLALTGAEAKEFLHGQVTNDIEALAPGRGCYAAFLTHKGKMLGDLRVLDTGDELLLDTERVALQELFNMIRRYKLGRDVELHKRTLERGLLSLIGPDARAVAGAGLPAPSTPTRAASSAARRCGWSRPTVGVDVLCDAERHRRVAAALGRGAEVASEAAAEVRAGRERPAALRRRPRRRRDPAGGRPQRARGLLREGLLRRPGDGRAAVLPRQAEPPPARAAAVRAGRDRRRAAARRARGRPRRHGRRSPPPRPDRARARAPRGRARRRRSRSATTASRDVVELPFATA